MGLQSGRLKEDGGGTREGRLAGGEGEGHFVLVRSEGAVETWMRVIVE